MESNENAVTGVSIKKAGGKSPASKIFGIILTLRQSVVFNCIMLALLGIGVGLLSLLLGATVFGLPMFWSYFDTPMILLLNLLPPVVLIFLVYFISGRAWAAFSFPAFLTILLSVVQFFKVQLRGDPFIISDIEFMREAGAVVTDYSLSMNWKIYFAAASFIFGVLFCVFMLKYIVKPARARIIASVATAAVSMVLYMAVYSNTDIYAEVIPETLETRWSVTRNFTAKGFIYPFIHTMEGALREMRGRIPDWYDEQMARQALESFGRSDIPDDKKVNVIAIMLEAFSDLSQFDVLDFLVDVYGPLHRIQEESVSGMVVTNVFAGGTIDTERLFVTGNTRLTNFRSPTNSYVFYLRSQGYFTQGFHAGHKWFYDRDSVNLLLGFDEYFFIEDFPHGNRTDAFFFPAVRELYMSRDRGVPYFSFNLSYQNHGGYVSTRTSEPYVISREGLSDESFFILNNYLSGIFDTIQRIEAFIDMLRDDPDPVVVLMFGDHMPWLGNSSSVYRELGINIDIGTDEGFLNFHSTPYFIWANDTAKAALGNDFTGYGGSFSPSFLMGELFRQCSWEGDGYMKALRELQASIDIINTPRGMMRENGVLTDTLSPEGDAAFRNLRMIEIYRLNSFMY
jgi:phosphoglycerol transferase MdoB-like AlkP superfamily enzyme